MGRPLVATADVHYLRRRTTTTTRRCFACRRSRRSPAEDALRQNEFFLKSSEEMAESFAEMPEALAASLEIAERCDVEIELGRQLIPSFDCPDGDREGLPARVGPGRADGRYGDPPPVDGDRAHGDGAGVIDGMGFNAYFLIVWDFVHYAKDNGIAVGPGRGSAAGASSPTPADHRRRPAPLRPAVRAVPEPRARVDAGYRHRLLRARARAGDALRDRQVRRRPRRADHHVRQDVPARGHARRRTRAGPRLRRRRPAGEADPGPDHGPPAELRGLPGAGRRPRRRVRQGPDGQADRRCRPGPRGHRPQRVDPRRRGRDLRPAADRHRAAPARGRRHGGAGQRSTGRSRSSR